MMGKPCPISPHPCHLQQKLPLTLAGSTGSQALLALLTLLHPRGQICSFPVPHVLTSAPLSMYNLEPSIVPPNSETGDLRWLTRVASTGLYPHTRKLQAGKRSTIAGKELGYRSPVRAQRALFVQ